MRNLCTVGYDVYPDATDVTAVCWDAGSDEIVAAFGPTAEDAEVRLVRYSQDGPRPLASWTAESPIPDLLPVDRIVSLQYFGDQDSVCVVLAGGDIVLVQLSATGDLAAPHIEIVGSVEAGIAAARWSPDEEVLALVTAAATTTTTTSRSLLLMSRALDTIGETALTADDLAASKHVSVGWGKKETQFHGRGAAKAMRDPTLPDKIEAGVLSVGDDGRAVSISWRGDGQFVAVNAVEEGAAPATTGGDAGAAQARRRVVRVYNREGVLDSASEPVDGLESSLSWRPEGNLMATVQRKPATTTTTTTTATTDDQFKIVFFERNGLRHGEFELRPPHTNSPVADDRSPVGLEWNPDSTVLAVVYQTAVQFWTMGNYHWYMKQEVATRPRRPLAVWHPEKPTKLLTTASDGLVRLEYVFSLARGSTSPPLDHGAVAVVDGNLVLLTPFRASNIPPPMSLFELPVPSSAVDVAFAPGDAAVAVLHTTGLSVFTWPWAEGKRPVAPRLAASLSFSDAAGEKAGGATVHRVALRICFPDEASMTVLSREDGSLRATTYSVSLDRGTIDVASVDGALPPGSVLVASSQAKTPLYVQSGTGLLWPAKPSGDPPLYASSHPSSGLKLPAFLPWVEVVQPGTEGGGGEAMAVGLSRNGHLYANERQLAKNCTSFVVTPDHLIFTTANHLLKFVHLQDVYDLQVPLDDPEIDERCRTLERGARLVTAVPSNMSVVLQMPRGNLETIFPRALVVAGIRKLVDALDYGRAFAVCRTQRVDMNILYDHRPQQFLDQVGLFLDQVQDASYIDLFLSSLREEDVSQTMYKDTRRGGAKQQQTPPLPLPPTAAAAPSKVNVVCDAVLASLSAAQHKPSSSAHRLQNMVTAHVCKKPPAIDDGLRLVAELWRGPGHDAALAERAIEHICFLVDVQRLYDHALGLYDLDLAMQVAQKSQMDPREYTPFVQALHAQPSERRRRFAIDEHLGRHEKALEHLHALDGAKHEGNGRLHALDGAKDEGNDAGVFAELLDYTDRHRLYPAALRLYRYDSRRRAVVMARYAAYLEAQSRFREAGLAYESLAQFAKATACYQCAGVSCWRECMVAAEQQQASPTALRELAATLSEALYEARDYAAAACLQLEYAGEARDYAAERRQLENVGEARDYAAECRQLENAGETERAHAVATAVRYLCKGYEFAEAMRVALRHGRGDLLVTAVDAGLGEAVSSSTELLADCRAQLQAQVPRIRELRQRALDDPLGFYEGDRLGGEDVPDDVSVAASSRISTSASLFTRYSTGSGATSNATGNTLATGDTKRTAQQRSRKKREEKKRARGRKGTVYEQAYLVSSVRRLIERVERARPEVTRLVAALVRRNMAERARAMEALMAELVEACQAAIAQVWAPGEGTVPGTMPGTMPETVPGTAPEAVGEPGSSSVMAETAGEAVPTMAALARLSLLG